MAKQIMMSRLVSSLYCLTATSYAEADDLLSWVHSTTVVPFPTEVTSTARERQAILQ
jgi:hypothetical protein